MDYYKGIKNGLNFFFGRSHNFQLSTKNYKLKKNIMNFDSFYDLYKINFFNKLKVLNYKNLSYKYRLKFKRNRFLKKIEGITLFKSFLNNFIKLSGFHNRKNRIKRKKRVRMALKCVSKTFKDFFHFIFFFYLNKFNIVIDCYNKQNFNIFNIIQIYKNLRIKRRKFRNNNLNVRKYQYTYLFRYKSKKIRK